jgi:hypothetical protein
MTSFNSNFLTYSLTPALIDLMSATSDSYPIGPSTSTTDFFYGSFICIGDLLIQFSSKQTDSVSVSNIGTGYFPVPLKNIPNFITLTGNNVNQNNSPLLLQAVTNMVYGYYNTGNTGKTFINFLSISPRPTAFYPIVPFHTTGNPSIYWSDWSSTTSNSILYLTFTSNGSIAFYNLTNITSITFTGTGGGGGGGSGSTGGSTYGGGGGGGGEGGTNNSVTYGSSSSLSLSSFSLDNYSIIIGSGGLGGGFVLPGTNATNDKPGKQGSNGTSTYLQDSFSNQICVCQRGDGGNGALENGIGATSLNTLGYGGGGGNGGTTGGANNGVDGQNAYYGSPTTINVGAGGGGGAYNNGIGGGGGAGNNGVSSNYGAGGNGSGSGAGVAGSNSSPTIVAIGIQYNATNQYYGGGGGGGGGGWCDGNGNGHTSGAGGNGGNGILQIQITFTSSFT